MSARPSHSPSAMRRYIQMSQNQIFIFVEGRDLDPYVYGRICGPICKDAGKNYEIVISDRVLGTGGGKQILTLLFDELQANNSLIDRSAPDAKLAIFYLHKDVDDISGTLRVSGHIVYTAHYCLENHIFCEGDLPTSIAIAASIDEQIVRRRIPEPDAWRTRAARLWRDWIVLCLVAKELALPGPAGYAANQSTINNPADTLVDTASLAAHISAMEACCGISAADFRRRLANAEQLTDRALRLTEHDSIFKGKWYAKFALREMELAAGSVPFNVNGAKDRLMASLIATMDFSGQWAEHFRLPLRNAIGGL